MFLTLAGSGMAFAEEPAETDALDRHSVWSYQFEGGEQQLLTEGSNEQDSQKSTQKESDNVKLVDSIDTKMYDSSRNVRAVSEID